MRRTVISMTNAARNPCVIEVDIRPEVEVYHAQMAIPNLMKYIIAISIYISDPPACEIEL